MEEKQVGAMPKEYVEAVWDYATTLSGMMCKYGDKWGETPKSLSMLAETLHRSHVLPPEQVSAVENIATIYIEEWDVMSRQEARDAHLEIHGLMEDALKVNIFPKPEEESPYPDELLSWNEEPCDEQIFGDSKMIRATFNLADSIYSYRGVPLDADLYIQRMVGRCLEQINYDAYEELQRKSGNDLKKYVKEIKAVELEKIANQEKWLSLKNIKSGNFAQAYTDYNGTDKEFMLEVVKIHGADMRKLTEAVKAVADKSPEGRMDFGYGMKLLEAVKKSPEYQQHTENMSTREGKQAVR